MLLEYLFIFILGLIIGSFLNVVIFRYDNDLFWRSLLGRSNCISCKKNLVWYELIPLISFLIQKRRCRNCGRKISWQYFTVELLTGIMFLLIFNFKFYLSINNFLISDFANLIYLWVIFSVLIIITVYDIKHKIIPDSLSFLFAGLSFCGLFFNGLDSVSWINLLAGPILATPFAFLWLISKGRWIGFGDAKLALGIGWFLGLVDGVSAIVLAFWIGSVFGIFLILLSKLQTLFFRGKTFTIRSEIPFAPFLILGTVLIFFFGWDILGLKLFLL